MGCDVCLSCSGRSGRLETRMHYSYSAHNVRANTVLPTYTIGMRMI